MVFCSIEQLDRRTIVACCSCEQSRLLINQLPPRQEKEIQNLHRPILDRPGSAVGEKPVLDPKTSVQIVLSSTTGRRRRLGRGDLITRTTTSCARCREAVQKPEIWRRLLQLTKPWNRRGGSLTRTQYINIARASWRRSRVQVWRVLYASTRLYSVTLSVSEGGGIAVDLYTAVLSTKVCLGLRNVVIQTTVLTLRFNLPRAVRRTNVPSVRCPFGAIARVGVCASVLGGVRRSV